jgi:hypothetical protein
LCNVTMLELMIVEVTIRFNAYLSLWDCLNHWNLCFRDPMAMWCRFGYWCEIWQNHCELWRVH